MTDFEQDVAEALRRFASRGGTVEIGIMHEHITQLAPRVAAAIRAAAGLPWTQLPAFRTVGALPRLDYPAREAALAALRGDS